jgi:hypothetical protein
MPGIPEFSYDDKPLAVKFQWMQAGPGPASAIEFGTAMASLAADFENSDAIIGRNLIQRHLGDGWQGRASTAANGSLSRAAAAIAANARVGWAGGDSSHRYGDSFTATRNAIHNEPAAGQNSWWGRRADDVGDALHDTFDTTFGVQSDYRARLAAYKAADDTANDALRRHEATAREALTAYQIAATPQQPAAPGGAPNSSSGHNPTPAGTSHRTAAVGHTGGGQPSSGQSGSPSSAGHPAGATPAAGRNGGQRGADTSAPNLGTESAASTPTPSSPGHVPNTMMPGPNGGFAPAATVPTPGPYPSPTPLPRPGEPPSYRVSGYPGGYRAGGSRPELAPRGGDAAPGRSPAPGAPSGPSAGGPGTRPVAGMPPMGTGGGGGGKDRQHRNGVYLPSDEPFRVEYDFDIAPAVIGLPDPDEQHP